MDAWPYWAEWESGLTMPDEEKQYAKEWIAAVVRTNNGRDHADFKSNVLFLRWASYGLRSLS